MKSVLGVSLLVIGLVIGVAGGFVLSTGTVARSNSVVTSTTVSVVLSDRTVTSTTTILPSTSSQNSIATQTSASSEVSTMQSSVMSSSSGQNVTISGPVSGQYGTTPYKVTFFSPSGAEYSFPVNGGQAFTGSIPNDVTYSVTIYFYMSNGGSSTCNLPQPLTVESSVGIYSVSLSC